MQECVTARPIRDDLASEHVQLPQVRLTGIEERRGYRGNVTLHYPAQIDRNGRRWPIFALQPGVFETTTEVVTHSSDALIWRARQTLVPQRSPPVSVVLDRCCSCAPAGCLVPPLWPVHPERRSVVARYQSVGQLVLFDLPSGATRDGRGGSQDVTGLWNVSSAFTGFVAHALPPCLVPQSFRKHRTRSSWDTRSGSIVMPLVDHRAYPMRLSHEDH
jgi:hypothetical protein